MQLITYRPIGIIHSPFKSLDGMPIQPAAAQGVRGKVVIEPEFSEGLCDLDGFSHIYLLYHLHLSDSYKLKVKPFLDNKEHGVFATRAPKRPNALGLSVVRLIKLSRNVLEIENVDIIDGTPLIDIKPYVTEMNAAEDYRIGWLTERSKDIKKKKSDSRFL